MATFSLDDFRTEVLSGAGLARTNRFEVTITPPVKLSARNRAYAKIASLYVEQASLPLLNIFTKSQKIFGPSYQRPISSEYGGEGLPMTFHVDRNMGVRNFFEDWMHLVINPVTFTVGYYEDYTTDIKIAQLDEKNNVTYEVTLKEAFPRNLNLMDLNHSSTNQTHRLNVLFAYRYWVNTDAEKTNPVNIPRSVTTPQVPSVDLRVPETNRQWNWQTGTLDDTPGSDLPPSA